MKYFLCRLIPPRPTFSMDMTPQKRETMQIHGAYWKRLADAGTAIAFGPVADPKGGWGVGIIAVADDEELRRLQSDESACARTSGDAACRRRCPANGRGRNGDSLREPSGTACPARTNMGNGGVSAGARGKTISMAYDRSNAAQRRRAVQRQERRTDGAGFVSPAVPARVLDRSWTAA
jgi:hypothetical protein